MWYLVIGGGLVSVATAGIKAWSIVAPQRSRERSVDRLALARENDADFDLAAAIEQLHVPPTSRWTLVASENRTIQVLDGR